MTLAADTSAAIEASRAALRGIAIHGVVCFDVVSRLSALDHMYQFSVTWFYSVFATSLSIDAADDMPVSTLRSSLNANDFDEVARVCMHKLR
jgi:hypothetical protein